MVSARKGQVSIHIEAPPEQVWSLVANLERMGEWSPECYRVRWLDSASSPARAGSRFKGSNKWGPVRWSMVCEVKTAEPGRELSWSTVQGDRELVRWTYRFVPKGTGTTVTESFDVRAFTPMARLFEDLVMVNRDRGRSAAMHATLERIKAAVEAAR